MDEFSEFQRITNNLFQYEKGLFLAPIRHHSPACAWAVRELIRSVKPKQVLIEAPADFQNQIEILLHQDTCPPVAIASIIEQEEKKRVAAYYPFCSHSPEYIALQEAKKIGAELSFIDLPSSDKSLFQRELDEDKEGQPLALSDDLHFNTGDYITALCTELACRDGFELWDHLFEARLGQADWQTFLKDVAAYCSGLRSATSEQEIMATGDAEREAFMAEHVLKVLDKTGPVVVIVGGFHVPAILEAVKSNKVQKLKAASSKKTAKNTAKPYLIRYSFGALDALNGYAAGLPQPGYYDYLWACAQAASGAPDWRAVSLDLMAEFSTFMRQQGHAISLPAKVEMLRVAEGLAHLRGRPGAMRYDLIDGAKASLIKGEAAIVDVWTERLISFLSGSKMGDVPVSAGSPPLVEDARRLARENRVDLSDGARRRRKLDIRRKPSQLKASQYFHAMTLLATSFAEREIGPDFINNVRTDLLFEEWSYAWSPQVEGRLIELSVYGDQLPIACLGVLFKERQAMQEEGQARNLSRLVDLFTSGLLAGLGDKLAGFLQFIDDDIQQNGSFADVATTLRKLYFISLSSSPIGATQGLNIQSAINSAYARLVYLCDDLPHIPEDAITACLEALRLIAELLRNIDKEILDPQLFDEAIDRVVDSNPPPVLLGAVLAICFQAGRRTVQDLITALQGRFNGAVTDEEERIGILRGILQTAPTLLLWEKALVKAVDGFLSGLSEDNFIQSLPHIRLAFTALNPAETDRVAEIVSKIHGFNAGDLSGTVLSLNDEDRQRAYQINKLLETGLKDDGLLTSGDAQ